MRARYVALLLISALAWSAFPLFLHAEIISVYTQSDDSGDITSTQPNFQNTYISVSLGNLTPGKDVLTITFTMKDPNASISSGQPGGVALGTCATCQDLQKYLFTDADRTLLSDGAFHTFTVQTGTTTYDDADGTVPIYINFFNLSQYHNSTHLKSDSAGTTPTLTITTPSPPPSTDIAPEGSITVYSQSDRTAVITNPQATFQNAFIDSASLGNLNLGQREIYLTFTIKDPNASNASGQPEGVCLQEASSTDCASPLQTYLFTEADRTLLSDGGFHTFNVETGTTTSTYADGTNPVSIGFFGLSQYQYQTKIKSNASQTIPYLTIKTPPIPDPCADGGCVSNVLFLPGIEGSRLYEGTGCGLSAEEKLWEPIGSSLIRILRGAGDDKVTRLFLDVAGLSVCSDIYTKTNDIINSAGGSDIYQSFIDEMNGLETAGTINDWKQVAYDWRLSLTDLLNKGAEREGKIYYEEATSTPYIEQTLRALASGSQTGKVTIVAHSNGGLVAKALLAELGDAETSALVDKLIMVGAPQSGAPVALGALLFGHDQGITSYGIPILRSATARALAINSPMAYHLLPSQNYFDSIAGDSVHPIARFAGSGYATERTAYGSMITNVSDLDKFIRADEGARVKPSVSDVSSAEIGNSTLIDYANAQHATLDAWSPPDGISVSQIAGWGIDTVSGIEFYTLNSVRKYRPTFVEDGDNVVTIPSALMMASSTSVKRYWVDLHDYYKATKIKSTHRDLFEVPQLEDFINNIIQNSTSSLPTYISTSQPSPISDNKLSFFLHSPLNMQVIDSLGNVTGLSSDGYIDQDIPNSTYGELGDVSYIILSEGGTYQLALTGQASGTFALEMQESSGNTVVASSTIANVPSTASTTASLSVVGGLSNVSNLVVDVNGDGSNIITISPILGDTVIYEPPPPPPAPTPQVSSSGGGGSGAISFIFVSTTTPVTATTSERQAVTVELATTSAPSAIVESAIDNNIVTTAVQQEIDEPKVTEYAGLDIPNGPIYITDTATGVTIIPQTASVFDASQQAGSLIFNNVFYTALIGLFVISLLSFAVYKDHTAK